MNGKNKQNQLLAIKKLIKNGYIERGVRQADLLIKQNKTVRELSLLIKKTLIKNRVLEKEFSLSGDRSLSIFTLHPRLFPNVISANADAMPPSAIS